MNFFVEFRRFCHALIELRLETRLFDLLRRIIAMHGREVLALLSEYAVTMQVAIQTQVTENVERVIDVLKRPARFVPAVPAFAEMFVENFPPLVRA